MSDFWGMVGWIGVIIILGIWIVAVIKNLLDFDLYGIIRATFVMSLLTTAIFFFMDGIYYSTDTEPAADGNAAIEASQITNNEQSITVGDK